MTNQDLLKEIEDAVNGVAQKYTAQPLSDTNMQEEAFKHRLNENKQYERRNELYSDLLQEYIKIYKQKEKAKRKYKCIFFIVIMLLLCAIIIGCLMSIRMMLLSPGSDVTNISVAIANVASIISTIIILPKIIADHLFPTNEESNMLTMLEKMQYNDAQIREAINKEIPILDTKTKDIQN